MNRFPRSASDRNEPDLYEQQGDFDRIRLPNNSNTITVIFCLSIFLCMASFVVFGSFQKKTSCDGYIDVQGGGKYISSPASGTLYSIGIEEKSNVHKGEKIFEIRNTKSTSEENYSYDRIGYLKKDISEIKEQIKSYNYSFAANQRILYQKRQGIIEKLALAASQQKLHAERMRSIYLIIQKEQKSYVEGYLTDTQYQSTLESYSQHKVALIDAMKSKADLQAELDDLDRDIIKQSSENAIEIKDKNIKIFDEESEIERESEGEVQFIYSPINGYISAINVDNNNHVDLNQTIATIIPNNNDLMTVVYVDSSSIGLIKPNMYARLRFAAYPYMQYGSYDGTVIRSTLVPIDTSNKKTEKQLSSISYYDNKMNLSYDVYRVEIKISETSRKRLGIIHPLLLGMKVHADIYTESRPLYQWLFFPNSQNDSGRK